MHADPIAAVILWSTAIFVIAIAGRFFASFLKQPAVLGELVAGLVVGNLLFF